jgi:hypothetical protein
MLNVATNHQRLHWGTNDEPFLKKEKKKKDPYLMSTAMVYGMKGGLPT